MSIVVHDPDVVVVECGDWGDLEHDGIIAVKEYDYVIQA